MSDIEDLAERISKAENRNDPTTEDIQAEKDAHNKQVGLQAGMEFTGSIIVGIVLGLGIDHLLGTKPIFFLIMFFFGVFTGFFNVYRVTQNMGSSIGFMHMHKELHPQEKDAKTSPESDNTDSKTDTDKD